MLNRFTFVWLRRDLRLEDQHALIQAAKRANNLILVFIFDENILRNLPQKDARVEFIHQTLVALNEEIQSLGGHLLVECGDPLAVWKKWLKSYSIESVYANHDYEPIAIERDRHVENLLREHGVPFHTFKDQVIFEKSEVVKEDGNPYTVFTPYSRKWKKRLEENPLEKLPKPRFKFKKLPKTVALPSLNEIGFVKTGANFPPAKVSKDLLKSYQKLRDFPAADATSHLGLHLRFGTISVRKLLREALKESEPFVNELIWREFFMQILFHFPHVVKGPFRPAYATIKWLNKKSEFERWCRGETGFPMVDAGMRQLNETGYMHNRVRMVAASFLAKHLLIDWRWGEAYFAAKLLDFELAANNGNWQWAAGCGCDAAPYFRVFNPTLQAKRFDPKGEYIKKWVPEFGTSRYCEPMVEHETARRRAVVEYRKALS